MRRGWILRMFPLVLLGFTAFIFIGGEIVMLLWNWLSPLFGLPLLGFWQALGLLALCRILFGAFGMRGGPHAGPRGRWGDRMTDRIADRFAERWQNMTPEERERFRQRVRERCGFDPGSAESKAQ